MSDSVNPSAESDASYRERRAVPRYGLIAVAEIIDPVSGIRMSGRISEIGRGGCYVDLLNTLPQHTKILVRATREQGTFESPGVILYVLERMGMGIGFRDTPDDQLKTLDSWLAELPPQ